MIPKSISKEAILGMIVLSLVVGSLILAIIDSSTRATFADLTKVAVGTYIGLHIPSASQRI